MVKEEEETKIIPNLTRRCAYLMNSIEKMLNRIETNCGLNYNEIVRVEILSNTLKIE